MFNRIIGVIYVLLGLFVLSISIFARTPEGNPLSVAWFISIIGFCTILLGFTHIFVKEEE